MNALLIALLLACSALHVWRLCETVRADERTRECERLAAARNHERTARIAAQAESARLAQLVRDGEAAYAGLLESLKVGGLVRVPTNEQLEKGAW